MTNGQKVRMKKPMIQIRDVEKNLFTYLFLNKVSTSKQIQRDIYKGISHQALYKRLNRLIVFGYLSANYHKELGGRLVYSLSAKGFTEFVSGEGIKDFRKQLQSNSIEHDLDLADIRSKLSSRKMVAGYYTENFIQSRIESQDEEKLNGFKGINFDAVVKVNKDGKDHFLPIEHERTLKFVSRYKDYFKKVYSRQEVSAILYICSSQSVLEKIQKYEQVVLNSNWPKVFYSTLDGILKNNSATFYNLKRETIILE